jgi:hypothetical protein
MEIDIGETHIRLTTDLKNHNLKDHIYSIRQDLKDYIAHNQDFLLSIEPVECHDEDLPVIIEKMYESSGLADVGPMACVAGTISELCLNYLIGNSSTYSIVENGGDIALVNDRKVLCGIYSNNSVLGNEIAFEIRKRKSPLGICTSSGRIGHSISFGEADSVTVISKSPSLADGLATRIANEVKGPSSEDKVSSALNCADEYREFFRGVLIISDENVGVSGSLPKIVETSKFDFKKV